MPTWTKIIVGLYLAVCAAAVGIGVVGSLGLFGMEPDALASAPAIALALPWSLWALSAVDGETAAVLVLVLCMLFNAAILVAIGMALKRRRRA